MAAPQFDDSMRCANHPNIETRLRCNKCLKPICSRCSVSTPIGFRCTDCAGVRGLPTYATDTSVLIRATGIGIIIATGVGILWGFFPNWQFYLALTLGFGVAEGMAWAANYKRGRDLQFAGIACVVIGLVIARVIIAQQHPVLGIDDLLNDAMNPAASRIFQIRLIPDLLFAILAGAIPFVRFR